MAARYRQSIVILVLLQKRLTPIYAPTSDSGSESVHCSLASCMEEAVDQRPRTDAPAQCLHTPKDTRYLLNTTNLSRRCRTEYTRYGIVLHSHLFVPLKYTEYIFEKIPGTRAPYHQHGIRRRSGRVWAPRYGGYPFVTGTHSVEPLLVRLVTEYLACSHY